MARCPAPVAGKAVAKQTPSRAAIPGCMLVEKAARTLPGKSRAAILDPHMVGNPVVILVAKLAANQVATVRNQAVMASNRAATMRNQVARGSNRAVTVYNPAVMVAEDSVEKARGTDQTHISHTNAD